MCIFIVHITNNIKQNGDAKSSRPRELVLSSVINHASLIVFVLVSCFIMCKWSDFCVPSSAGVCACCS
jgi:hypothetical protein